MYSCGQMPSKQIDIEQSDWFYKKLLFNICTCIANFSLIVSVGGGGGWNIQLVSQWGRNYPITGTVEAGLPN